MKLKQAIVILIHHTSRDLIGTGTGIRSGPSKNERMQAKKAIERTWKYIYGWEITDSERYNIGLYK